MSAYRAIPWALKHASQHTASTLARGSLLGFYAGLALGLPCLLGYVGQYVTFRWTQQHYDAAQNRLFTAASNRPSLWPEPSLREFATNELISGALSLAKQTVWTTELGITTTLRLIFSAAQLLTVSWTPVGLGCLVGLLCVSYTLGRYSQTNLGETLELREAQNALQDTARSFWDNVALDNTVNRQTWLRHYRPRIDRFFMENWRSQQGSFTTLMAEELSYLVPMVLRQTSTFEAAHLGQQPALFPARLIDAFVGGINAALGFYQIENLRQSLATVRVRHEQARARYKQFAEEVTLRHRIRFERITLRPTQGGVVDAPETIDEALQALEKPGMWRMQGSNGAGKTSFMLLCKERFGSDCLLLPAKHDLDFDQGQGSSGQLVMRIFERLDAIAKRPRVLLLDEWNANLDKANEAQIRDMLQRWQSHHAVIEVIHR